ncbi:MAG: acyl-CoA ligase (AMP-forming), exosortase A system-associated, partial [Burkholderiaceae bacterium]|nr:acyl-CoA ligase (AMP-forming), exosortase A system-associated [Burkholderiaceae bacterium]
IEEVVYSTQLVAECAAFGVPHETLGQSIALVATPRDGAALSPEELAAACRERLPIYMVPAHIEVRAAPLPRNPNGKIDRKALAASLTQRAAS